MELKAYLKKINKTSHAWAKEKNFEPSTIWRIVNGVTNPSIETAQKIVQATGGEVGYGDLVK